MKIEALIKFGEKEHIKTLQDSGELYFRPINDFPKIEDNNLRGDDFEGVTHLENLTSGTLTLTDPLTGKVFKGKCQSGQIKERQSESEGKIYCMYGVYPENFKEKKHKIHIRNARFGSHFLVITNVSKFINMITGTLNQLKIAYKIDKVEYYDKHKHCGAVSVFQKTTEFSYQNEFRILIDRRDALPEKIKIGSLRDISIVLETNILEDFDMCKTKWIYATDIKNKNRFLLGTRGKKPLLCFGVNPSAAEPDQLDPTLKSVERFSKIHSYDSWIMMNLYAQRSTDPNGMHDKINKQIHKENLKHIENVLAVFPNATIWAAWGTLIEKRPFLKRCLEDIHEISQLYNCNWVTFGKRSKAGHPHHPLYLKKDAEIENINIDNYLKPSS